MLSGVPDKLRHKLAKLPEEGHQEATAAPLWSEKGMGAPL